MHVIKNNKKKVLKKVRVQKNNMLFIIIKFISINLVQVNKIIPKYHTHHHQNKFHHLNRVDKFHIF